MYPIPEQLRDIHGLDPLSWWPPAPGWWLIALSVPVALYLLGKLLPHLRMPMIGNWRWDAARRLRDLRRRVRHQDGKDSASELSELLRRIAIARFGRAQCAGLAGREWLAWLQSRDPSGFAWETDGRVLLDTPYAPPGSEAPTEKLLKLIDAAHNWIADEQQRNQDQETQKVV